ncbi:MAG: IgGFc-binding protein, partial [bacterium]|nr:IgGFc-binding protein [Candidatus Kapabacteria bacterium]
MIDIVTVRHASRIFTTLAPLILVFLATSAVSVSQVRDRIDNRGREFRIAFLPTNGYDDNPRFGIVLWSEQPATGTLFYVNSGKTLSISVTTRADTIWLDTFDLLLPAEPRTKPLSFRSLHATFDREVTIYGINTMRWSSDGFVALPNDALGTQHVVLSYPNTQQPNPLGEVFGSSDFPSQFAVLATENGTRIDVVPKVRLNSQPGKAPFSVNLDAGEVFLAQAQGGTGSDLTGTTINSNRPIVVYGSHQRTNVPYSQTVGRDHLIEHLPPVNRWQTRAIVTPHAQIPKTVADANVVRVLAAFDNTIVSVDSIRYATMRANDHIEMPLDRVKLITSSQPILIAQYHHSSVDEQRINVPNDSIGDPFMMLVPSREQFDSVYNFVSYDTKDFSRHFINVVIPTERLSSVRIDGNPVRWLLNERVPKSSYSFAQVAVSAGTHKIDARVPFGLYIYGYGPYNSYGHHGGYVFDTLFKDHKEPRISVIDSCIGAIGAAYDDSTSDFGMERLELLGGSRNVDLVQAPAAGGSDSIHFRLNLLDPYQDGFAVMQAV